MKIFAYGKDGIGKAAKTAEVALIFGVNKVIIEYVPAANIAVVSPSTLAFCPVAECSECQAMPCPFGHKSARVAELQKEYEAAEVHLNEISRKLREVSIHG
jgi:hypothetical protein